jgi:spermidine synthase
MRILKTQSVPKQQFKSRGKPGAAKPGRRTSPTGEQFFGWLLLTAFFASGAASLIYEIAWVKALSLVFGSTVYAVTTVLAVFMGGLGAGSWVLGRRFDRQARPIMAYVWLEAGIAVTAPLTFAALPLLRHIYTAAGGGTLLRFGGSALLLLLPTFLMGGTFPLLVRILRRHEPETGAPVSRLYALNAAGAVAGTLAAGFLLMPELGIIRTALVAAGCNLLAVFLAWASAKRAARGAGIWPVPAAQPPDAGQVEERPVSPVQAGTWAAAVSFVSGATAMMLEIAWTRLLATPLGGSTYAFTIMLAAFLIGIAGGARLFTRLAPRLPLSRQGLGLFQLAIMVVGVVVLAAWRLLPYLVFAMLRISGDSLAWLVLAQFLAAFLILLPPALLYGLGFPWLAALYAPKEEGVSGRMGRLYAINAAGAIAGALLAGFFLLPRIGSYGALAVALAASGTAGALLLRGWRRPVACAGIALLLASASALGLLHHSSVDQQGLFLMYRWARLGTPLSLSEIAALRDRVFLEDGLNCTVAVTQAEQDCVLQVNGKVDAGSNVTEMRTQVALAALPLAMHPSPRRVLVIGFGAGVTTHVAAMWPGVERVDTVEIEPAVLQAAPYFKEINGEVYRHPRCRLIVDDARHFLFTARDRYDVIISHPSNPWIAGTGNLFTSEFYREAKARLNSGGIFLQWVQAYHLLPQDFSLVARTLKGAFRRISLWYGVSDDLLLVASDEAVWPFTPQYRALFQHPSEVSRVMRRYLGVDRPEGIWAYVALGHKDFAWLAGSGELNTDDSLVLEYRAPWRLASAPNDRVWQAISAAWTEQPAPNLSAQDRLTVAETLLRTGKFREAADLAQSIDKELQGSVRLALFRGDLQRQYGSLENADLAYRDAMEKGEPARGLVGLALAARKSDPATAEARLRQAIAQVSSIPDVDMAQLQAGLAAVLAQTGRFEEAITWQQRAIQSEETSAYVRWAELGQLYLRKGDSAAARVAFRKSLALKPYGYDAHYGLAMLCLTAGRMEEAVREFRFLLRFHPLKDLSLWEMAADTLRRAGYQREADRVLARGRVLFAK